MKTKSVILTRSQAAELAKELEPFVIKVALRFKGVKLGRIDKELPKLEGTERFLLEALQILPIVSIVSEDQTEELAESEGGR